MAFGRKAQDETVRVQPVSQEQAEQRTLERVLHLLDKAVGLVNLEEVRRQEADFDSSSRRGRELLYLMSNEEWIRGTFEDVELLASDSVETTVRVTVDVTKLAHETIRNRTEHDDALWLPLAVFPPPPTHLVDQSREAKRVSPSPRVIDPSGQAVQSLLQSEARRAMAAALADIFVEMGDQVADRVNGEGSRTRSLSTQSRHILSAALYRAMRDRSDTHDANGHLLPGADEPVETDRDERRGTRGGAEHRIAQRAQELRKILAGLKELAPGVPNDLPGHRRHLLERRRVLAVRAARVVHAVSIPTTLVTVSVPARAVPPQFTIHVPSAELVRGPSRRRWLPHRSCLVSVGLLLPSGEATRNLSVSLGDGLSLYRPRRRRRQKDAPAAVEAQIEVLRPPAWTRFEQVLGNRKDDLRTGVREILTDLADLQLDALAQTFRHHREEPDGAHGATASQDPPGLDLLEKVRGDLDLMAEHFDRSRGEEPPEPVADDPEVSLITRPRTLFRNIEYGQVTPSDAHLRALGIATQTVRTTPTRAWMALRVTANKSAELSMARWAGVSSLLVLIAVAVGQTWAPNGFDAQVLAAILVLFPVIMAGQIRRPDRSTLPGALESAGWTLVALTVLPPIVLGIAVGFSGEQVPAPWLTPVAVGAVVVQASLTMLTLALSRKPPGDVAAPDFSVRPELDYPRVDALRTAWWRTITANALLLGRPAYGYVVHQQSGSLVGLLRSAGDTPPRTGLAKLRSPKMFGRSAAPEPPANMLALLRAGTEMQSLNFLVFRQRPGAWPQQPLTEERWLKGGLTVPVPLDTERLVAREALLGSIDLYLGMPNDEHVPYSRHPLHGILEAARRHARVVLDVQLPSLPPKPADDQRFWARVRIGVGSRELKHVADFLEDATKRVEGLSGRRAVELHARFSGPAGSPDVVFHRLIGCDGCGCCDRCRRADPAFEQARSETDVLDVVLGMSKSEGSRGRWYAVAVSVYPYNGAEEQVLAAIDEHGRHEGRKRWNRPWQKPVKHSLRMAGLVTSLLHGSTIMLMLLQDVDATPGEGENGTDAWRSLQTALKRLGAELFPLAVAEAGELAHPPLPAAGSFVRLRMECSDQPGLYAHALDRLNAELADELGGETPEHMVRHAHVEVADGRVALCRAIIHAPQAPGEEKTTRIERALRRAVLDPLPGSADLARWWEARTVVDLRSWPPLPSPSSD